MLLSQYQQISIFSTYICIVAFIWDFRSTFWLFQCYNMGGGNNLRKWRKYWNFITAHYVKFCIHYNTNNVEFSQSFVFCFHFFLVEQSKRIHCFLQNKRIDGKKKAEGRKEGRERGWMSALRQLHFIFENLRCKLVHSFYSLVSENGHIWILDFLWLIYLKMSVPFWRDRHLDSNADTWSTFPRPIILASLENSAPSSPHLITVEFGGTKLYPQKDFFPLSLNKYIPLVSFFSM